MSDTTILCPTCGTEHAETASSCRKCSGTASASPERETSALERGAAQASQAGNYPGGGANVVLRVIGSVCIVAGFVAGVWILSEFGTSQPVSFFGQPMGEPQLNRLVVGVSIGVALQGVLVGTLLIALAGIGDNLIAVAVEPGGTGYVPGFVDGKTPWLSTHSLRSATLRRSDSSHSGGSCLVSMEMRAL